MASINGITIKGLKTYRGHEGNCLQGNIYIDGKKQGFWSQDSWGGPDRFEFDITLLFNRIKEYYKANPPCDFFKLHQMPVNAIDYANLPTRSIDEIDIGGIELELEIFLGKLIELIFDEKEYKKVVKQGFKVMGILNFLPVAAPIPSSIPNLAYGMDEASVRGRFVNVLQQYPYAYVTMYKSLKDFTK